jgi:hypothetical protein
VYAPGLADRLVRWAQGYLDNNVERQASQGLEYLAESIPRQLVNPEVMREGAVASLYSRTVVTWSSDFVASADCLSMQDIQFLECTKTYNVQGCWRWMRDGEIRMIMAHKGTGVFDTFCGRIRDLATANEGTGSTLTQSVVVDANC